MSKTTIERTRPMMHVGPGTSVKMTGGKSAEKAPEKAPEKATCRHKARALLAEKRLAWLFKNYDFDGMKKPSDIKL